MNVESTRRFINHSLEPCPVGEPRAPAAGALLCGFASVLAAGDELAACKTQDEMFLHAVEVARDRLGLERVSFYLCDTTAGRIVMRGTWGTGHNRETTDERGLYTECSQRDYEVLRTIQSQGALWLYHHDVPRMVEESRRSVPIGHGWLAVTPLVSARRVVGVMYNDCALSHSELDDVKQTQAAVFCGLLAGLFTSQQRGASFGSQAPDPHGPLVQSILDALERDPLLSGEVLARELRISPGHLARSFKASMGLSLVEYRNRLRMRRFFSAIDRGGTSLLEAARQAGFGSYAQFHRVHCKLMGAAPSKYLAARCADAPRPADGG